MSSEMCWACNNHRVISESDEGGGCGEDTGLRSVHRKIKKLFGKVDNEGELAGDDFELEDKESESEEEEEVEEAGEEQLLYWEVMLSVYCQQQTQKLDEWCPCCSCEDSQPTGICTSG